MERFGINDAGELYGINHWGTGYFDINKQGHLSIKTDLDNHNKIDVYKVTKQLEKSNIDFPVLLRFPQILASQVKLFHEHFARAIKEFEYEGSHLGVFPMKVNQQKVVVQELIKCGKKYNYGIEVGSKAELVAALATNTVDDSLILCNGYKDESYISLALCGLKMGRKIFLVIEHHSELEMIVEKAKKWKIKPLLGVRLKLNSKGSGRWETSGGMRAKFGLSASDFMSLIDSLKKYKMKDQLQLLHFHIGSQITEIKRIKNAIREGSRYYAKAKNMGLNIKYLDVGGGLGIDYDGSRTSSDSSCNYGIQEYANDVIYTMNEVCVAEDVDVPTIITESGRFIACQHALLVMNAWRNLHKAPAKMPKKNSSDAQIINELFDTLQYIGPKNYREYYHDAIQHREEMYSLFDLGYLSIEERAKGEILCEMICKKALQYARKSKFFAEEFMELERRLASKYLCGFSMFQSVPDSWALEQLFPIMPISRLDEKPTNKATLADLTCDSDGEIDSFVDLRDVKKLLELHELKEDEPYYLGVLFIGAYQEVIGDFHNLFGQVTEAHIFIDDEGDAHVERIIKGNTVKDMMQYCQYDSKDLITTFNNIVDTKGESMGLSKKEITAIKKEYTNGMSSYTYAK